jgi:hypothetical protein
MSELDPFEKIRQMSAVVTERAKKAVDNLLRKKDSEKVRRENYIAELKACAEESAELMNDPKYPRQQKFLTELRSAYSRKLEQLAANPKGIADGLLLAVLGAKIQVLDELMNEPKKVIKEYEAIAKELNK